MATEAPQQHSLRKQHANMHLSRPLRICVSALASLQAPLAAR